ncbi:MAG: DUF5011 domain-containing protein [Bacilli bacterium]|nr:DUF5011 domain-containing protein [Bacilli bacterium]
MSKKCKVIVYLIITMIISALIALLLYIVIHFGMIQANFVLKGDEQIELALNEYYKEEGYEVFYHFKSYHDDVLVTSNLDESKLGDYKITYQLPQLNIKKTRIIHVVDKTKPEMSLKGNKQIFTFVNNEYKDEGAIANDNYDGDLSDKIKVENNVNIKKEGSYEVIYRVQDNSGNQTLMKRKVIVSKNPMSVKLNYDYDDYDNTAMEWWFNKSEDHQRNTAAWSKKQIKQFASYYIGEDEKVIYLTFDEGGSDQTYIKEIANVLNRYEIQGTFFLTRNYILNEADFIRELIASGHVIGNHTRNHLNMSSLANASSVDEFVEEVTSVEKAYMEVSGQEMIKVFRFPKGEASERSMKMLQDLGYKTFFWSHAYYDYGPELSYQDAYKAMHNYYHNGAIYLIHPNNKGNYVALEDFIKEMLDMGYKFKTVDQIK